MATFYATFDGVIQSLTPAGDGKYDVKLVSGSRTIIYYGLSTVNVHPTQQVTAGQLIGSTSGDSNDEFEGSDIDVIVAPSDGYISNIEQFGNFWIVTFVGVDGKITRYVSLTEVFVARCQAIKAGDIIGFKRSGNYIWNQYSRQQPTSNAWISGKFRADGAIGVGVDPQYALHVVTNNPIAGAFTGRVRGVNAVNDDEFITKAQLPAPITFLNALEAGGVNIIHWGGPLVKNTVVDGLSYGIQFNNLGYFNIAGQGGVLNMQLQTLPQTTNTSFRLIAVDGSGTLSTQDRNGFIWNQFTGAQTPGDWWISGNGRLTKLWINSSANYGTTRFIAESTANADDVTGYFVNDKTFGNAVNIGLFTAVRVRATTPISQTGQTVIAGARNQISFFNTAAITTHPDALLGGMAGQVYYGGTGSILGTAKVAGYISDINLASGAGATITHLAAFYALKPFQSVGQTAFTGSVTNYYGLYLDDVAASNIAGTIVNRYGIYQLGSTDINRFNGHIDLFGLATGNTTDDILLIDPSTNRVKRITRAGFLVGAGETDKNFAEDNLVADANRTHTFGAFSSEITYNSIAGFGMKLSSSSTAAAGGNQALLQINLSGANANSGQTTYGIRVTNDHTGTNPTNYGIHATVTGGNTASAAIRGVITGDGYAIFASSVNGDAVNAGSTSGIGGNFGSSSNTAVQGVSSTGMGALFGTNGNYAIDMYRGALAVGEMTAVAPVIRARRLTSGFTAANGFGQSWEFYTSFNGGGGNSNVFISKWTDAAILTRTSQFIIQGVSNATTADLFTLDGNGQLRLNKYGVGSFTGTLAKLLGSTNTGVVIEVDPGSVGGGSGAWGDIIGKPNGGDFIFNQSVSAQTGSSFWIDGASRIDNTLRIGDALTLDRASYSVLNWYAGGVHGGQMEHSASEFRYYHKPTEAYIFHLDGSGVILPVLPSSSPGTPSYLVRGTGNYVYTRTTAQVLSDIGAAPASGGGNYIQNQNTAAQSANAWIDGTLYLGSPHANQIASGQKFISVNGVMAASPTGHALYFYADFSNNSGAIVGYNYATSGIIPIYIQSPLTVGTWNTAHTFMLDVAGVGRFKSASTGHYIHIGSSELEYNYIYMTAGASGGVLSDSYISINNTAGSGIYNQALTISTCLPKIKFAYAGAGPFELGHFKIEDGTFHLNYVFNETVDSDKILVYSGTEIKYMTKAQLGIGGSISAPAGEVVYGTGASYTSNPNFLYTDSRLDASRSYVAGKDVFRAVYTGNQGLTVNEYGEVLTGTLTTRAGNYALQVGGTIIATGYAPGGAAATWLDGAGAFYKNLNLVNPGTDGSTELHWGGGVTRTNTEYKFIVGFNGTQGADYSGQFNGGILGVGKFYMKAPSGINQLYFDPVYGGGPYFSLYGYNSYVNITRTSPTGIGTMFEFVDSTSGGFFKLGGVASSDFLPALFMQGSSTYNSSSIISQSITDSGSQPVLRIDSRLAGGAIVNQDLIHIGSYDNIRFRFTASGTMFLHALNDATGIAKMVTVTNGILGHSTIPVPLDGTYTPTLTAVTNVSALTSYTWQYKRVNNTITVSGRIRVTPTAATTDTIVGISLPFASSFTALEQCAGNGSLDGAQASSMSGPVTVDKTDNTRAAFRFYSPTGGSPLDYFILFQYRIM